MNKELTPLEALERLRPFIQVVNVRNGNYIQTEQERFTEMIKVVKDNLSIIEKSLKALEIIKNKVMWLVSLDNGKICKGHYRVYDAELYLHNELTKEEYDLLKEVIKDD